MKGATIQLYFSSVTLASHTNALSCSFFIYKMGIIIALLRMLKRRKLISTVGNTVDTYCVTVSLTVIIMLSILPICVIINLK